MFYVSIDGFDTHANQGGVAGRHANLLAEVSGAITAFYKDLAARGHKDRLLVMTFSEFGRRAKENGSQGHRPRLRGPDVPGRRQGQGRASSASTRA